MKSSMQKMKSERSASANQLRPTGLLLGALSMGGISDAKASMSLQGAKHDNF